MAEDAGEQLPGKGSIDNKNILTAERAEILATDLQIQEMFGLTAEEIRATVLRTEIVKNGFTVSPGFCSPGYGEADSEPLIQLSSILPVGQNGLLHENKHGLHFRLCEKLFETDEAAKYLELFEQNVLGDTDFVEAVSQRGTAKQREYLERALEIIKNPQQAAAYAWMLGALAYQHAYFVDPAMAEAAASFKDRGKFLNGLHWANRTVGIYLLPGVNPMEGYGNTWMQVMFREAPASKRALLVKKAEYRREEFFGSREISPEKTSQT